jgi:two-component sensor histidine kinase
VPRILYVDDDEGLRRLTQRAMTRRGFEIEVAENADAGLARLSAEQFDLVAIDHHMPGKNGRQMLDEIVALPDHPPVVFVTGNDDTAVAVEALHAGALDFVVKTVGDSFFDVLDGRLRQALSRARLESDKRAAEDDLRRVNARLELLIREVHHRVSNSLQLVLSFVAMQANQADDPRVHAALDDIQNRIKAISEVHQRLYTREDLTTIDLDEYLAHLVGNLRESLAERSGRVQLELTAEPVEVVPDTAVSIGVIVNELIANALKYAFEQGRDGRIAVDLSARDGAGFAITVEDDGAGMDTESAPQGTGLGTRIVKAMARGLGSELTLLERDRGTAWQLVVTPPAT